MSATVNIGSEGKHFTVCLPNATGVRESPLHRLFLRGIMRGDLPEDGLCWHIPMGTDAAATLAKLQAHFGKYGLPSSLAPECSSLLRARELERERFSAALVAGARIKQGLPEKEVARLEAALQPGFQRVLAAHQAGGVLHLETVRNGANFSVPGSGKTSVVLAYFHLLKQRGEVDAVFVIGPASCFEPWEHEYEKCFGVRAKSVRLAGMEKQDRRFEYRCPENRSLYLVSYHTAARDVEDILAFLGRKPCLLVLDESHYVKRPEGGVLADSVLMVSGAAPYRVILTGTPMPNGLPDLWSQFTFLWPEIEPLGPSPKYLRDVKRMGEGDATKWVKEKVGPLFYRVTKSQLRLEEPSFHLVNCEMPPLQQRIYSGVAARFFSQIGEAPTERDALREWRRARATRLLQISSNPALLCRRYDRFRLPPLDMRGLGLRALIDHYAEHEMPAKIAAAVDIAERVVAEGRKVLIWSYFVHNLEMLKSHLSDLSPAVIHGGVPLHSTDEEMLTREAEIARFKEDAECRVLIANPAACAESISLHLACHDAIYVDRTFNCAHYLQSLDRIHRIGLPPHTPTTYYLLLAEETIDSVVDSRLAEKMEAMRAVVEGDIPGAVPGYWADDLGSEEDEDLDVVEAHIREAGGR